MNLRKIFIVLIALFILGYDVGRRVQASTIMPGSAEDPVVTVGYVKTYLDQAFKPVADKLVATHKNIKLLTQKVQKIQDNLKPQITLIIGNKNAKVGSKTVILDTPPTIHQGRTILPLRFIGEALKAGVQWDSKAKKITYVKGKTTIILKLNDKKAIVNGKTVLLDAPPLVKNGRTLVPARFISENLNATVNYVPKTKTVTIKEK